MQLTYDLDTTTVEVSPDELATNGRTIRRARRSEERKGRKVTVLVRLEVHEAGDKQTEFFPRGRLFPRPLCALGAIVPVLIADKLRSYAKEREQPLSDLTRILWTEFLIAMDRKRRGDYSGRAERRQDDWANFIENRLNDVLELRQSKKKISFARTKQVRIKPKAKKKASKKPKKKAKKA